MASHHTPTPVLPSASAEEVERKIDELYRRAESDAGPYTPAGRAPAPEEPARQRGRVATLLDDMTRRTDMLGRAREMLQAIAGSQARTEAAASEATALLPETPEGYFDQAQVMSRLIARQKSLIGRSPVQRPERIPRAAAEGRRREAAGAGEPGRQPVARAAVRPVPPAAVPATARPVPPAPVPAAVPAAVDSAVPSAMHSAVHEVGQSATAQRDVRAAKAAVQRKLADARALLADARALVVDAATAPERTGAEEPVVRPASPGGASQAEARKALAFARAQIGKPYVWGAAGPGSYDCSGLAQAAWKAAGVALPRAVRDQAGAGRRIPLSEALPGDLVFFHGRAGSHGEAGVPGEADGPLEAGHVGVYAGDGIMIHAPWPGALVREESIFYEGASAILGVVRPA